MYVYSVRRCVNGEQFARRSAAVLCANVRLVQRNFNPYAAMMASATATSASFAWRHVSIDGRYAFCIKDCAVSTISFENKFKQQRESCLRIRIAIGNRELIKYLILK